MKDRKKSLAIVTRLILGNVVILAFSALTFFLLNTGLKIHDFGTLKWPPLFAAFVGFYLAGKINIKTKVGLLSFLYPSLLLLASLYFTFPLFIVIIIFATAGLILSRTEINKKVRVSILTMSIAFFVFYLFSQPLILRKEGFGKDALNNLYHAKVLWDFSSYKPSKVPDEAFENINGAAINLSEFAGKNLYISFWSTTCGPCLRAKPDLNKMKEQYKDQLVFIDISIDRDRQKWEKYILEKKPEGIQLISGNQSATRANFSFDGTPHYALVNRKGDYKPCPGPVLIEDRILENSGSIEEYIDMPQKIINFKNP